MEWLSLILLIALGLDSGIAQGLSVIRQLHLTQDFNAIMNAITSDVTLLNELIRANASKQTKLGAQILLSSPVGSRIAKLQRKIDDLEREESKLNARLSAKTKQTNEAQNEYNEKTTANQTSGSTLVDVYTRVARPYVEQKISDEKAYNEALKKTRAENAPYDKYLKPAKEKASSTKLSTYWNDFMKGQR